MAGLSLPRPFIFCIATSGGPVGDNTLYPVGADQEKFFKWYYRVKTWEFTMQYSASAGCSIDVLSASTSQSGPYTKDSVTNIVSEENYACTIPNSFVDDRVQNTTEDNDFGDFGSRAQAITSRVIETVIIQFSSCYFLSGKYYPLISISAQVSANAGGNAPGESNSSNQVITIGSGFGSLISIPIEVDGEDAQYRARFSSGSSGSGATTAVSITSLKLTPKEYWPYNPGSGGPIWDSTTGAELRNPFSIQTW